MWNRKEVETAPRRGSAIGRAGAQSTGLGEQVGALHVPWSGPAAPSPPSRRGLGSLMLCCAVLWTRSLAPQYPGRAWSSGKEDRNYNSHEALRKRCSQ